ncbi:MAG: isoleucine--tRNA ligase [Candidatus Omnitrophica bacterium]|nr:isoleucine--tRNA ligase [Candidatus Omnitrophota bacterium]
MDYKPTLNLPKTDFAMKADLPKREPLFLKTWQENDIYGLICKKPHPKGKYVLHDGPPYANGNIHIGHALNKTLKDIIIKYKTMRGFNSPYVPGWDCHGLPVEHALFKELKMNKYQINQVEFRKKAHAYAMQYVAVQREEFKRLGVFGDWDNPYLTLSREYEEAIIGSFLELLRKGYIYRGLKPVNWCFKCETALAEAEVEYEDHTSPSVFVKFKLEAGNDFPKESYLVIWTTTPWTLVANVAVAVHPDFSYSYLKTDKGNIIVANVRMQALPALGIEKYTVLKEFKGKELEGSGYEHPFGLRKGKVVLANYVSAEEGSGLVHTAPGHGADDFLTGLKYKLEVIMPVDPKGNFDSSARDFKGMNVYDANKAIVEKLQSLKLLLLADKITHSYPHCWRCKNPIIFRATNQWFLNIDHNDLRKKALAEIKDKINFIPEAGRERIASMVELRPDWCLSRQRYWGVPIPALICKKCNHEFLDPGVIEKYREFTAKEGTDCWFIREAKDFIPAGLKCKCGASEFVKGTDILDVWFDSGVSSQAVLKKRKELAGVPCEMYLEGSDQHRGWFQSSLIPSICIDGKSPFKSVLTHGHVVDGEGRKMSKSMGNVIPPQDIIKDYGADIIRLWVASSDYNEDIRISKEMLARLSEAYRKIRNTAKFILSNLYDFKPDSDYVAASALRKIDRWAIFKMVSALEAIEEAYDKFEFYKAYKNIYDFCNETLSMFYLDMVKGRLYTCGKNSQARRAAQSVLYELLDFLVRVAAPILVFTAEEIWQNMPKTSALKNISSVHLLDWPQHKNKLSDSEAKEMLDFDACVIRLIPGIAKLLEEKRGKGEIGSSFDAQIKLLTNSQERYTFLESLKGDLTEIFKVSQVEIELKSGISDIAIEVSKAAGKKCPRCWNYSLFVGKSEKHPLLCDKCEKAIGEEK